MSAPVRYRLLESGLPRRYGVWCRWGGGKGLWLAAAPFSRDRRAVERLVRRLNLRQMPPQAFRDAVLSGALASWL